MSLFSYWYGGDLIPFSATEQVKNILSDLSLESLVVEREKQLYFTLGGKVLSEVNGHDPGDCYPVKAVLPSFKPSQLGDESFKSDFGLEYNYVVGAMANGIASVDLVKASANAGLLAFYGAAGLGPAEVEKAIFDLNTALGDRSWGANLIYSPYEPGLEARIVDLYLSKKVDVISASAYLDLSLDLLRFRLSGICLDSAGKVLVPNRVIAKVSRVELAEKFLSPAPEKLLRALVDAGHLTEHQAKLAEKVPVAQDISVEADSGGHTDNRPAIAMFPNMLALKTRIEQKYAYDMPLRMGLGGGISTPASAAAAFAMGAAYILTGSVNQACIESGSSDDVRKMLAETGQADVIMAPAADMFEMGVKLQVLKRGTFFAQRAQKLYELYRSYPGIDAIPADERLKIEKQTFRADLDEIWKLCVEFWSERDPKQLSKADKDPKHKMALIFRWYLGKSSRWANQGDLGRKIDYQVWCGPSMGAFNEWVKGSFLEEWKSREAALVAKNIMFGAARLQRVQSLRNQGLRIDSRLIDDKPMRDHEIEEWR